ncbi:DNA mismatch repair protein MutT [Oceanobacillus sp. E9]|uniref:NUDIX hydrolase n=1 Tax=Oceanobacillus sp. E9 TaxID=1742575 RepID=UPI000868DEC4|nr:NUDIX domain-containing protein [Oceanobacillus sp. E9]OEH54427.1 DNA mismatch repair protein MutT [Oceanobacillus sp. E9]
MNAYPLFIINVEAAIYNRGKWLIIKRSEQEAHAGGLLFLVGGKVEHSEIEIDIIENALKREVMEEVGIVINNPVYIYSNYFTFDADKHVVNIVFACLYQEENGRPIINSKEEIDKIKWMSSEEINQNSNAPIYLKESIQRCENRMFHI